LREGGWKKRERVDFFFTNRHSPRTIPFLFCVHQVYNESLRDLLAPDAPAGGGAITDQNAIQHDADGHTTVTGAARVPVDSEDAAAALVAAADLGRSIGAVVIDSGRPDLAGGALRRVKCPVLLLVGERDEELAEDNAEALELLNCPKELRRIDGAPEEAARQAADWLLDHLGHPTAARFRR